MFEKGKRVWISQPQENNISLKYDLHTLFFVTTMLSDWIMAAIFEGSAQDTLISLDSLIGFLKGKKDIWCTVEYQYSGYKLADKILSSKSKSFTT